MTHFSTSRIRFEITGVEKIDEIRIRELLRTNEAFRFYTIRAPNKNDELQYDSAPYYQSTMYGWDGINPSPSEMLNSYNKIQEYRSEICEGVIEEVNTIIKRLWNETDAEIIERENKQNRGENGWPYPHCPDKYNIGLYGCPGSEQLKWKSLVYKSIYEHLMSKLWREWYDYSHIFLY